MYCNRQSEHLLLLAVLFFQYPCTPLGVGRVSHGESFSCCRRTLKSEDRMRDCIIYNEAKIFVLAQHHFPPRMHFHRCTSLWKKWWEKLLLVGFSLQSACESALCSCQPLQLLQQDRDSFSEASARQPPNAMGVASTVVQPQGIERSHRRNLDLRSVLLVFVQLIDSAAPFTTYRRRR